MILVCFLLCVGLGPALARVEQDGLRAALSWGVIAVAITAGHSLTIGEDPILRMVVICALLLVGMKAAVYAEWGQKGRLSHGRYLIFAFLWFGMDPGSFKRRRAGLSWKGDLCWGLAMMFLGTAVAWIVWRTGEQQIFLMFLPMSLGFHFGALRVLKAGHRLYGFPVRTLFPNLLRTTGVADFWSRRWNTGYSQMMQRLVGRPVGCRFGRDKGLMAVFLVSGLLHEVAIAVPVTTGWGLPTLYFIIHGSLALLEEKMGFQFGKVPTLLLVALPLGLLFPVEFQEQVIARCLGVFELI